VFDVSSFCIRYFLLRVRPSAPHSRPVADAPPVPLGRGPVTGRTESGSAPKRQRRQHLDREGQGQQLQLLVDPSQAGPAPRRSAPATPTQGQSHAVAQHFPRPGRPPRRIEEARRKKVPGGAREMAANTRRTSRPNPSAKNSKPPASGRRPAERCCRPASKDRPSGVGIRARRQGPKICASNHQQVSISIATAGPDQPRRRPRLPAPPPFPPPEAPGAPPLATGAPAATVRLSAAAPAPCPLRSRTPADGTKLSAPPTRARLTSRKP